jgi:hypothetical protein
MRFTKAKSRLFVFCAGCWGFAGIALADSLPPVWIPAAGTPITSWDSEVSGTGLKTIYFPTGFEFTLYGVSYNSAVVSSNGSIYFIPNGEPSPPLPATPQPVAATSQFLQGLPRIAPAWYNTQAIDGTGTILYEMLPGQAVFTFENIASYIAPPGQSVAPSNLATFQLTLSIDNNAVHTDGSVTFAYDAFNSLNLPGVPNSLVGSPVAIVGITSGQGAADPGSLDLSVLARTPSYSYLTTSSTVYQAISNNPPDNSQLAGLDLFFAPVGLDWKVTSTYVGAPTPEPSTLFEIMLSAATLLIWIWRNRASIRSGGRV